MNKQSGFGVASLIIGIISLVFSCVGVGIVGIVGIILSIVAFTQKDRKKGTAIGGIITSAIAFIISLAVILAGGSMISSDQEDKASDSNPKKVATTKEKKEEKKKNNKFSVGDVVETSDLRIKFISAEKYKEKYNEPKKGNQFYRMEFEVENISDSDQFITSYDFECYADDYSAEQSFVGDDELSANLSPGKKAKGAVYFEVPKKAKSIHLEYECDFWTEDKVIFLVK